MRFYIIEKSLEQKPPCRLAEYVAPFAKWLVGKGKTLDECVKELRRPLRMHDLRQAFYNRLLDVAGCRRPACAGEYCGLHFSHVPLVQIPGQRDISRSHHGRAPRQGLGWWQNHSRRAWATGRLLPQAILINIGTISLRSTTSRCGPMSPSY